MTEEIKAASEPISDDKLLETVTGILEPKAEKVEEPKAQEAELTANNEEQEPAVEDEKPSKQLSPEIQKAIDKRIAKEVSKRKALEAELETEREKREHLEHKVTDPKKEVEVPTDLRDMTQQQLLEADNEAREYMVWANNGPLQDGYETTDANGETKYFSPEEIQETYNHFHQRVLLEIPKAQQAKQGLVNKLNAIAIANPVLQDESSEEYKTFAQVWTSKEYAQLKHQDNGPEMCWLMVKGLLNKQSISPLMPKPPSNIPKTAPKVPVAPAPARAKLISKQSKTQSTLTEADYKAAESGDLDAAIAKLISQ
jgi:hypothetical protein